MVKPGRENCPYSPALTETPDISSEIITKDKKQRIKHLFVIL